MARLFVPKTLARNPTYDLVGSLPFSGGPHVCMGQQLALTEVGVYKLVRHCTAIPEDGKGRSGVGIRGRLESLLPIVRRE